MTRLVSSIVAIGVVLVGHVVAGDVAGDVVDAASAATVACDALPAGAAPPAEPLASFTPQEPPRRLIDTRDGTGGFRGEIGAGCTIRIDATAAGAPADAEALALSVTALAAQRGFLTVFPCSSGQPPTSNVNARPFGTPTPNLAVALVDDAGRICIYSQQRTHLVVDMTGWWTTDGPTRFRSVPPVRADDSRLDEGRRPVPANVAREIDLSDIVPPGTVAVVANLTVTEPAAEGFLTAFPCGVTPLSSNLNFRPGESRAVAIVVGVSADRKLCVQSNTSHHVVLDVSGYYEPLQFGPAAELVPVAGDRLADSRTPDGPWQSSFGAGTVRALRPVAGRPDAASATAVVVNTVAVNATGPGFVTIYPCDDEVPFTSVVNFDAGEEATNLTFVDLSADAEICFYTSTGVDLVVDLFGVMVAPPGSLAERLNFDRHTWPPFTPTGTDYVVECGGDTVELELDLLPGTSAAVNNVPVAAGTLRLPGNDDRLTTVRLRRGDVARTYWFRCVPDDFPRFEVDRPGTPAPGWYLTTTEAPGGATYALIFDELGAPVWYKRLDRAAVDLKRRNDGRLVYAPLLGPRYGVEPDAGYRAMSLFGTLVGEYISFDEGGLEHPTDHHDYVGLPGGGYALISYPIVDGVDLTAEPALPGEGWSDNDTIAENVIQEFDAAGDVVWSFTVGDHFGYNEAPYPIRWPPIDGYPGGEVDVWHVNALTPITDGSGDYLVTARHMDAVFRVDRSTVGGDVEWVLSSLPDDEPQKSGAPRLEIIGDVLGGPKRPHHAVLQGDVLTIFDNRTDTGQPSRAVAYRIDEDALTATLLWSIEAPGGQNAFGLGSVDLGSDGSVVVGWGPVQPMFQEFDADREVVLQMRQVPFGQAYRIIKEPKSVWSASLLRLAAGGAAEAP